MRTTINLSPLVIYLISLILIQCVQGSNAFSCTQISKTSFRYYTNDERCGIKIVSPERSTTIARHLYNENRQATDSPKIPLYSAIASSSWTSTGEESILDDVKSASSDPSAVKEVVRGITNVFGVVADVMIDSVARGPSSKILEEEDEVSIRDEPQVIYLVDINWLKAHEKIVSEERVRKLSNAIQGWKSYRLPLLVDARSGAILDGHHRYAVGRLMGLSRLPVILVDYLNDDTISVDVWPECGIDCLSKEDVIEMSLSDEVFPPKTSRHDFVSSLQTINVPLTELH
jgi:hypothetical protein